jgi:hypothetical protein
MAGHDKLTADGKKFFAQIAELKKLEVRVGYQRGAKSQDGVDILDIAAWNELGTSRAPSRPFIRRSADDNKMAIEAFCKAQLQAVGRGDTAERVLNAIGTMQTDLIRYTIDESKNWAEPNAPSTVRMKSKGDKVGDQPLVDTGLMSQSVHYVIVPKGGS